MAQPLSVEESTRDIPEYDEEYLEYFNDLDYDIDALNQDGPKPGNSAENSHSQYQCQYCLLYCQTLIKLNQHIYNHALTRQYSCLWCQQTFKDGGLLQEHRRCSVSCRPSETTAGEKLVIAGGLETTTGCGKVITTTTRRERRIAPKPETSATQPETNSEQKAYGNTCEICSRSYFGRVGLKIHKQMVHGSKGLVCLYCSQEFGKLDKFNTHLELHKLEFQLTCASCRTVCQSREDVSNHVCSSTAPYKCKFCNIYFGNIKKLGRHYNCIHQKNHYVCSYCSLTFRHIWIFETHLSTHLVQTALTQTEKSNTKEIECTFCSRTFKSGRKLQAHLKLHLAKKLYKCVVCDRLFKNAELLKSHQCDVELPVREIIAGPEANVVTVDITDITDAVHEKPAGTTAKQDSQRIAENLCELCGQSFYSIYTLATHMKTIHSGTSVLIGSGVEVVYLYNKHHEGTAGTVVPQDSTSVMKSFHEGVEEDCQVIDEDHEVIKEDLEVREDDHELIKKDHEVMKEDHKVIKKNHQIVEEDHQILGKDHQIVKWDREDFSERERTIFLKRLEEQKERKKKQLCFPQI